MSSFFVQIIWMKGELYIMANESKQNKKSFKERINIFKRNLIKQKKSFSFCISFTHIRFNNDQCNTCICLNLRWFNNNFTGMVQWCWIFYQRMDWCKWWQALFKIRTASQNSIINWYYILMWDINQYKVLIYCEHC